MTTLRLLRLAGLAGGRLTATIALGLAVTASYVAQSLLAAQVLTAILRGGAGLRQGSAVAWIAVLLVVRALLLWAREVVAASASATVKQALRQRVYAKLLALGPGELLGTRTGVVQTTMVDGVERLEQYYGAFLPQLVTAALGSAGIVALMWAIDSAVGLAVLLLSLAVALSPLVTRRLTDARGRGYWEAWRGLGADYLDAVQGLTTLKAFNASEAKGAELATVARGFARASLRFIAAGNVPVGLMGLLASAGTATAVGVGALRLAGGAVGVTGLLVVLLLAREAFRPLTDLQHSYHAAFQAMPAARAIFELLDSQPKVADPPAPARATAADGTGVGFAFEQVTFTYPGADRPAVAGLDLAVTAGETVAIVGRSGAGKTTVAALLQRFFDPQAGRVLLGGHDVRTLALEELRAQIAVVAQDTYLFHGTVRDNLLLGRPGASDAELRAAARAAGADEFIAGLPRGYDTIIGERGLRLSGGERQRIAIARALLKDAPLLILDEATSSLDAANEAAIQQALERLARDRTTLVIAHRLSTVRDANRILVLEAGRITESGDHHSLVAANGAYARLVAAQSVPTPPGGGSGGPSPCGGASGTAQPGGARPSGPSGARAGRAGSSGESRLRAHPKESRP